MRRYWINSKPIDETIIISNEKFHHIFNVTRNKEGSRIELISSGVSYLVEVQKIKKKYAECKILSKKSLPSLKKPYLNLFLSMPKISTFETMLEKCVELGVKSIIPVFCEFSTIKSPTKLKLSRWQKIIESASEQSNRGDLLKICEPCPLESALSRLAYGVFSDLKGDGFDFDLNIKELNLFVGSEGGFADVERVQFLNKGFKGISLGPNILKVETACVSLISICKYKLNLL